MPVISIIMMEHLSHYMEMKVHYLQNHPVKKNFKKYLGDPRSDFLKIEHNFSQIPFLTVIPLKYLNFDLIFRFPDPQNPSISISRPLEGMEGCFLIEFNIRPFRTPSCSQNLQNAISRKPLGRFRSSLYCCTQ